MTIIRIRILTCAIAATLSILMTGCNAQSSDKDSPSILRIGILPDEGKEKLTERYEPLRKYLSDSLGLPCQLVFPDSYDALVELFGAGGVELAYFGGLTFVQTMVAYDAQPLVMRDIDTQFTSYYVVRADSTATGIEDCKGLVFAFGSRLSTSGHLMPRHYLATYKDIEPEIFFREVQYSGAHDTTIEWVRDGVVDVGAVNAQIFNAMVADGRIDEEFFRIVCETRPYIDYVWAVQSNIDRSEKIKLRDAFLALSSDSEEGREVLRSMDANGFLPADVDSFSDLKEIALNMELLQ